jgi:hypothetical protein
MFGLLSEGGGTRTHDLGIKSPLLYQLSYAPGRMLNRYCGNIFVRSSYSNLQAGSERDAPNTGGSSANEIEHLGAAAKRNRSDAGAVPARVHPESTATVAIVAPGGSLLAHPNRPAHV